MEGAETIFKIINQPLSIWPILFYLIVSFSGMKTDFADIKEKVFDLSDKVVLLTTEVAVIKNDLSYLRQSPPSSCESKEARDTK